MHDAKMLQGAFKTLSALCSFSSVGALMLVSFPQLSDAEADLLAFQALIATLAVALSSL